MYEGVNLGSGFEVELTYAKGVVVDGSVIGLNDDFDLTTPLARFLTLNEELINDPLASIETILRRYRHQQRKEFKMKMEALTYRFLTAVYDTPQEVSGITETVDEIECDPRVRSLVLENRDVLELPTRAEEALRHVPLALAVVERHVDRRCAGRGHVVPHAVRVGVERRHVTLEEPRFAVEIFRLEPGG